ncbi:hypothetical protein [Streptomyces cinereoruber]|uniref:hypothetical protein n=1 Tax=Streptomyces cinereoruber TaxID=67260 RepID=UPI00363D1A3F
MVTAPSPPLPDLLPLVVNVLEAPEIRNSTEGRSALHEVDILLDVVAVYQGPA